jgi:hypothetical protein
VASRAGALPFPLGWKRLGMSPSLGSLLWVCFGGSTVDMMAVGAAFSSVDGGAIIALVNSYAWPE